LDWEFAGIYPRCFEIYLLITRSSWEPYYKAVLRELGYLTPVNDSEIKLLGQMCAKLTRYHIVRTLIISGGAVTFRLHLLAIVHS
jgi:hypothetical protein